MSKLPLLLGFYMPGEAEWAPAWLWAAAYARNPAISQGSAPQFGEWQFSLLDSTLQLGPCSTGSVPMWGHLQTAAGEYCFGPGAGTRHVQLLTWETRQTPAHSKDQKRLSVMPRTPLCREALVWGIRTCVLNSCLWTPAGDLGCGCGNGSGGACAGLGTWSETSAGHGKLTSSASASCPETVIWRGHRLPQAPEMGQYIPSVHWHP